MPSLATHPHAARSRGHSVVAPPLVHGTRQNKRQRRCQWRTWLGPLVGHGLVQRLRLRLRLRLPRRLHAHALGHLLLRRLQLLLVLLLQLLLRRVHGAVLLVLLLVLLLLVLRVRGRHVLLLLLRVHGRAHGGPRVLLVLHVLLLLLGVHGRVVGALRRRRSSRVVTLRRLRVRPARLHACARY